MKYATIAEHQSNILDEVRRQINNREVDEVGIWTFGYADSCPRRLQLDVLYQGMLYE